MNTSSRIAVAAMLLVSGTSLCASAELTDTKAEQMGRVEDFFMHNFRDVSWRKSLEWGDVRTDAKGNRSIRYKYEARIWDKKTLVMNQEFTFDKDGTFVRYQDVEGFPKTKERAVRDVTTQGGPPSVIKASG